MADMKTTHKMKTTLTFLTALLLTPLAALSAAASSAAPTSQGRMPSFSWDRVPCYMHIRKDTAFTADEIRYLASFPLVTFEKLTVRSATSTREFR